MKFNSKMVASVAMLGLTMGIVGCSSDDGGSAPAPATKPAASAEPGKTPAAPAADTLYARLGGNEGIKKAVHAIVVEELKDPELASYFFFQVQKPVTAGHPTADQIEECFVLLVGNAAGGPELYPAKVSGGFECRGMTESHKTLGIPGGVFTKFNMIAAGVLKGAGVKDDDLKVLGGVLESTREEVAQDKTRDTGKFNKQP